MKHQHTNKEHNSDLHKKVVAQEREHGGTKHSEKKSPKNPNKHRSNRVEHDGSHHVL